MCYDRELLSRLSLGHQVEGGPGKFILFDWTGHVRLHIDGLIARGVAPCILRLIC
jgi:hypothetical protein